MEKITSSLAREGNGNIQITFSVPWKIVEAAKKTALLHLIKDVEVPGFRKGKAPEKLAEAKISPNELTEHALREILPQSLAQALTEHKIKPAVYPKFELISAKDNEVWQVRAVTCELKDFELGDYKKVVTGALRSKNIAKSAPSREEKEQATISALLTAVKVEIPPLLIQEEADARLSNLLNRIEKLGLSLENYLASLGKTAQTLRDEYEKQARDAISLDLILNKVAEAEGVKIKEEEVSAMITAAKADPTIKADLDTPDQRRVVESLLKRRQSLEKLINLV